MEVAAVLRLRVAPELLKPDLAEVQAEADHIMEVVQAVLVTLQTQAHLKEAMVAMAVLLLAIPSAGISSAAQYQLSLKT